MADKIPSFLFVVVLASCGFVANGIRYPTHQVRATCLRSGSGTTEMLNMTLTVDMNTDKQGRWRGINANNDEVCDIDVTQMPALQSAVYTYSDIEYAYGCGFDVIYTNLGQKSGYRWRIRYREGPEEAYEWDGGIDRFYTIVCLINSPTNEITAEIKVSTPNLDQTIVPKNPTASLQALHYNAGTVISNVGIAAGNQYKLQATIDVSDIDSPRPVGAWVKRTILSDTPDFTNIVDVIIGDNGCVVAGEIRSPVYGFTRTESLSTDTKFVHETGTATAYMYDTGTDMIYIKAIWGLCFVDDNTCLDPCGFIVGRRRRDVTGEEKETEKEVVMSFRVYNPNKTENSQATGMDNAVLIGVCVAAAILLLLLMIAACFIVGCMRRRSRRPNQVKIPPEGFDNKVHAQC